MLILTRKLGQELIFNGQIRIRVLCTRPGSVRLGIEAPHDVNVLRGELGLRGRLLVEPLGLQAQTASQPLPPARSSACS